jgi:hypothetical protein
MPGLTRHPVKFWIPGFGAVQQFDISTVNAVTSASAGFQVFGKKL